MITAWLLEHGYGLQAESLWENITEFVPAPVLPLPAPATLGRLLCDIAGRAVLNDSDDDANLMIIQLARTTNYLHREMAILVGADAPYMIRVEAEAAAILKGETP